MLFFNNVFVFGTFVDKYSAIPNFNLVNEPNLTKVLKAKVFVHIDGELRTAHLIFGYNLLSSSFQAPTYLIKARDPSLRQINIVVPGFLVGPAPDGVQ